ncbi:DUF6449 domain-containing protein [Thermosyntropha sp.]|uniref:DUF6449 domain-containing protein n=1 Tax=Thermosyntropha sp. TaxID=2740820 RepID=UPI0025D029E4|nr:DUF6449 domain-containing protein [Thermosyntropha sp.]MBO8158739.1 hypothetical protein [Thermosyntropha sp.]
MKSEVFLINKGILKNNFKRFGWIGIVYFLAMFFLVPLRIIMEHNTNLRHNLDNQFYDYLVIFYPDHSPFLLLLLLIMPVLVGTLLFRYLQAENEVGMQHTLPVTRDVLYHTHMLSGSILLSLPVIVIFFLNLIIVNILNINLYITNAYLLKWLILSLLLNWLLFFATVMMGMITGMSFLQVLLTFVIMILSTGLIGLVYYNLNFFIYGWALDYYGQNIEVLSPLLRISGAFAQHDLSGTEWAVYIFLIIVLYFASLYLYRKRRLERVGEAIAFDVLRVIFKYGVVFCFMLLFGAYFGDSQGYIPWVYFGYFAGSILAYIGVEALLSKSVDIIRWKKMKGYFVYAGVVVLLIVGLKFDIFGYEKRLPSLDNVDTVYFSGSFLDIRNVFEEKTLYDYFAMPAVFEDRENIKKVHGLHKYIIARRDVEKANMQKPYWLKKDLEEICFVYRMKDGSLMSRQYVIRKDDYKAWLKPIYESYEYKETCNALFRIELDRIEEMEITPYGKGGSLVVIKDPVLIKGAVEALKKDLLDMTYEEMVKPGKTTWAGIDFKIKVEREDGKEGYERFYMDWEKSFTHFEKWLKEVGKYEEARVMPGKYISYVLVQRVEGVSFDEVSKDLKYKRQNVSSWQNSSGVFKIDDPEKIEYFLRNCSDVYRSEGTEKMFSGYILLFVLNNGNDFVGVLEGDEEMLESW